ncbi:uncharacterized protein LOC135200572 [Macrobrachium nipponense]|uniref:uncharacterized protein LOC135200572 n=1 Tax=Macrobrachium nipponense TaxID=159736 RepID=UPI0030C8C496
MATFHVFVIRESPAFAMNSSLIFVLGLMVVGVSYAAFPGPGFVNPWVDTSRCPPGDTIPMCQLKKSKCTGVRKVFQGAVSPVGAVVKCANATGVMPGPDFFLSIGLAFAKGNSEMLADQVSTDPSVTMAIRQCTLNATGLLSPDNTIDRFAVATALNASLSTPALSAAAMEAAFSCPEPEDFQPTKYINCITSACISSVTVGPAKFF